MMVAASRVARFRYACLALIGEGPASPLGIAVSGGPDSLALLLLAQAAFPGAVLAATVDHGLRPEAAGEAAIVAGLCAGLGIPHETLRPASPITGSVQAAARAVRYQLLDEWAARRGLAAILTAHHLDDQAETLMMRLLRGAGVAGLAGVRARHAGERCPILRPLLAWRRAELAEVVAAAGVDPVEDPSNRDPRYDRTRIRHALAQADWIDPARIATSAAALAQAEDALGWATERLLDERLVGTIGEGTLDATGLPREFHRRLVLRVIAKAGATTPRGSELDRLLEALAAGNTATLAGLVWSGGQPWRFHVAPPRRTS